MERKNREEDRTKWKGNLSCIFCDVVIFHKNILIIKTNNLKMCNLSK